MATREFQAKFVFIIYTMGLIYELCSFSSSSNGEAKATKAECLLSLQLHSLFAVALMDVPSEKETALIYRAPA